MIVKFTWDVLNGWTCDKSPSMSGEYVPLAEYQELRGQYQELADNSNDAIQSLVKQRSKLQALIQRVVELSPDLYDEEEFTPNPFLSPFVYVQSPELKQLLADCKEAAHD